MVLGWRLRHRSPLTISLSLFIGLAWTVWIMSYNRSVELPSHEGASDKGIISLVLNNPEKKNEAEILMYEFLDENPPKDSRKIAQYLHEFHLTPPSTKPYNLNPKMGKFSYSEIDHQLRNLFRNQNNGFFVEAGANDGQLLSNTLRLEMKQNWTGLLIEPNSFMVPALRLTNRRAWIADVCLSTVGRPVKVRFLHKAGATDALIGYNGQGIIENSAYNPQEGVRDARNYIYAGAVECFPLSALLLSLNRTVVDYLSLDVEGVEYKVLQNFPFHKITFKVISIEHDLIPEGFDALETLLIANNFTIVFETEHDLIAINDDYIQVYNL